MIVFLNQVIGGSNLLSGGEKISVELIRRWSTFMDIEVVIPENGLDLIQKKENLNVRYKTLPLTFLDKKSIYWKYTFLIPLIWLTHTIRSCLKIFNNAIYGNKIYSSGDFFCNTIPAFLLKVRYKKSDWIVSLFHVIDSPFRRKGGNSFFSNLASYLFQRFSFLLIKNKADIIFALNDFLKNQLIIKGFDENKIYVLGAGINLREIDAARNYNTPFDACFMARLSPTKGIFDIPDIWKMVSEKRGFSPLILIGDGLEKDIVKLESLLSRNQIINQIEMVGFKNGTDKYSSMKSSKIFIFPSYEEGFAISILEAMACKLPVVAWNLPAYETIYKEAIRTVPKGDIKHFAEEVVKLLNDDNLRNSIAKKGYNIAMQYDWDSIAQKAVVIINQ